MAVSLICLLFAGAYKYQNCKIGFTFENLSDGILISYDGYAFCNIKKNLSVLAGAYVIKIAKLVSPWKIFPRKLISYSSFTHLPSTIKGKSYPLSKLLNWFHLL